MEGMEVEAMRSEEKLYSHDPDILLRGMGRINTVTKKDAGSF